MRRWAGGFQRGGARSWRAVSSSQVTAPVIRAGVAGGGAAPAPAATAIPDTAAAIRNRRASRAGRPRRIRDSSRTRLIDPIHPGRLVPEAAGSEAPGEVVSGGAGPGNGGASGGVARGGVAGETGLGLGGASGGAGPARGGPVSRLVSGTWAQAARGHRDPGDGEPRSASASPRPDLVRRTVY